MPLDTSQAGKKLRISILTSTALAVAVAVGVHTLPARAGWLSFLTNEAKPKTVSGNYLAARFAQQQGDVGAAIKYLKQARNLAHDDAELARLGYRALLVAGRIDEALPLAEELLATQNGDDLGARLLVAVYDMHNGKYDEALEQLNALPDDAGFNAVLVPILRAWAHLAKGEGEQALALSDIGDSVGIFSPFVTYHRALMSDVMGQTAQADALFAEAQKQTGGLSQRMLQVLSEFYLRHDMKSKAEDIYTQFADENQNIWFETNDVLTFVRDNKDHAVHVKTALDGFAEALYGAATVSRSQLGGGSDTNAMAFVRLALYARPAFPAAQLLMGAFFEDEGRYDDAIAVYDAIKPDSLSGWKAQIQKARNLFLKGETDQAIQRFKELASQRPDLHAPLLHLSDLLRSEERYAEAVEYYDNVLDRIAEKQEYHWPIYYARGIAYERLKEWKKAEQDFNSALELIPDQPDVLNYLGYSWLEQGRNLLEARDMLEKAVRQRPHDPHIIDSFGWAYYKLGEFEVAAQYLERAIELMPDDAVVNEHLGDIYWALGRQQEARFQWERAQVFDPDEALASRLNQKLEHGIDDLPEAHTLTEAGRHGVEDTPAQP